MSNLIPGNQKHLTLDDRKFIEDSLNEGLSFKEIAKYLCKDPTTISKEIRLHRLMTFNQNGYLIIRTTFAPEDLGVNGQMYVKRLSSVTLSVHHVTNVIRYASLS